jgi:hypothetical protein
MTLKQHKQVGDHYRRLALHELARGHRRLALHYFELAQKHEAHATVFILAAA